MDLLLRTLPVLGCLAMGAMMWLMMRGQLSPNQHAMADPAAREELNRLRAEIELLKQDRGAEAGQDRPRPAATV